MGWATHKVTPASCAVTPASCTHLDHSAIEAALADNFGNGTATARKLGVPSSDLRALVWSSSLVETVFEQFEQTYEKALTILYDGLKSDSLRRAQERRPGAPAHGREDLADANRGRKAARLGSGAAAPDEPAKAKWVEH
jgi:hypothetical protein